MSILNHNFLMKRNPLWYPKFYNLTFAKSSNSQDNFQIFFYAFTSLDTTFDLYQKIIPTTFLKYVYDSQLEQNPKWLWYTGVKV